MKDAKVSVEDFPRKTTKSDLQTIQNRISDLEKKQVNFHQQNLTSACGMVDTHEIEEKLEALGQNVVSENTNGHTLDVNVTLVPVRDGATISVTWNKIPGKDIYYDISAECILPTGIRERFLYSGISDCQYKIGNLRPETAYQICVAVQGEKNVGGHGIKIMTLKSINCQPFNLNGKCANEFTFVSEDSKTLMPKYISNARSTRYKRLLGTTCTIEIASSNQYWESKILFSCPRGTKNGDLIFNIGICHKSSVDRIGDFHKNFNAYTFYVVKRGKTSIKLEFQREGYDVLYADVDIEWKREMELHLGYYVDIEKHIFSVINVNGNHILWTFENINTDAPYVPVFTHSDHENEPLTEIKLLTGEDVKEIPSCMLKLLT